MASSPDVRDPLSRLEAVAARRPELGGLVRLHRELIPLLFGAAEAESARTIPDDQAAEKIAAGVPLLRGQSLLFNAEAALAENWRSVCSVLTRGGNAVEVGRLAEAVNRRELSPAGVLEGIIGTGPDDFRKAIELLGLDSLLAASVLRLAALPVLAPIARSLERHWNRSGWSRGHCPACGSWPLLAEFRGLEQFRWLRCGLCAGGWQVDRMFCPFCENRDHRGLQDFFVEGEEQKYRVTVCDGCGGFVRGLPTLVALSAPALLVAEIETAHLDFVAERVLATNGVDRDFGH